MDWTEYLIDQGYLPTYILRQGIRSQLRQRLSEIATKTLTEGYDSKMKYVAALRSRPMAVHTDAANQQHYEVEAGVLKGCLGPRMKYSACLYPLGSESLASAEIEMLSLYLERAQLKDGMSVLDLGCGWGSGALFFAEMLPRSRVTALSNSRSQKTYIDQEARRRGLKNLKVVTGDVVEYEFDLGSFDRVISIEMFEHMKNYAKLMDKVSRWLKPSGKLFVHLFCHRSTPYDFDGGWMSDHFFTGGTMPSADLLLFFQGSLTLDTQWWVNGSHYARTCEDWRLNLIQNKKSIWPHLQKTYGEDEALKWFYRWEVFYLACAELFAFDGGDIWGVSHYLFSIAS